MRTESKFEKAINEAKQFINFHKKPVWLVPTEDDYKISIIPPKSEDIPFGTNSILYGLSDNKFDSLDHIESTRKL